MENEISMKLTSLHPESSPAMKPNWSQIIWFLSLNFGLTWLLDYVLYMNGGLTNSGTTLLLQLQMLLPTFSAMVLGTFFFRESPLYYRTNQRASRWFVYYYFLLTIFYLVGAIAALIQPDRSVTITSLLLIPNVLGLVLLITLRFAGGKDTFIGAGLAGGKVRIWILFGLGLIAFYGLQTLLNYLLGWGQAVDLLTSFPEMAAGGIPQTALMPIMALNTVVIGPFLGLILAFGEEYGWRGFLQTELIRLGRIRGVFLVGVIWGVWHWPVIWMGYNFPGYPALGSLAMLIFCILFAYFLAYSVFKSQGIWTSAYLHALNNQVLSFYFMAVVAPSNILLSFGAGFPGLALGLIIVLLILRDPLWKTPPSEVSSTSVE